MIGYVTLGSKDRQKAGAYYDELLSLVGAKRAMEDGDRLILWADGKGAMLGVIAPADGNAPTVGNGVMVALAMPSREAVDAMHAKAMSLGSKDEGAPGVRGGNFYGAYFRDLDGNKLCCFKIG
ncbi:MAG: VOC family protein [Rhizobiales bacterium]|nr:VOC family protein [Hyphomicrobiales bacterium]